MDGSPETIQMPVAALEAGKKLVSSSKNLLQALKYQMGERSRLEEQVKELRSHIDSLESKSKHDSKNKEKKRASKLAHAHEASRDDRRRDSHDRQHASSSSRRSHTPDPSSRRQHSTTSSSQRRSHTPQPSRSRESFSRQRHAEQARRESGAGTETEATRIVRDMEYLRLSLSSHDGAVLLETPETERWVDRVRSVGIVGPALPGPHGPRAEPEAYSPYPQLSTVSAAARDAYMSVPAEEKGRASGVGKWSTRMEALQGDLDMMDSRMLRQSLDTVYHSASGATTPVPPQHKPPYHSKPHVQSHYPSDAAPAPAYRPPWSSYTPYAQRRTAGVGAADDSILMSREERAAHVEWEGHAVPKSTSMPAHRAARPNVGVTAVQTADKAVRAVERVDKLVQTGPARPTVFDRTRPQASTNTTPMEGPRAAQDEVARVAAELDALRRSLISNSIRDELHGAEATSAGWRPDGVESKVSTAARQLETVHRALTSLRSETNDALAASTPSPTPTPYTPSTPHTPLHHLAVGSPDSQRHEHQQRTALDVAPSLSLRKTGGGSFRQQRVRELQAELQSLRQQTEEAKRALDVARMVVETPERDSSSPPVAAVTSYADARYLAVVPGQPMGVAEPDKDRTVVVMERDDACRVHMRRKDDAGADADLLRTRFFDSVESGDVVVGGKRQPDDLVVSVSTRMHSPPAVDGDAWHAADRDAWATYVGTFDNASLPYSASLGAKARSHVPKDLEQASPPDVHRRNSRKTFSRMAPGRISDLSASLAKIETDLARMRDSLGYDDHIIRPLHAPDHPHLTRYDDLSSSYSSSRSLASMEIRAR